MPLLEQKFTLDPVLFSGENCTCCTDDANRYEHIYPSLIAHETGVYKCKHDPLHIVHQVPIFPQSTFILSNHWMSARTDKQSHFIEKKTPHPSNAREAPPAKWLPTHDVEVILTTQPHDSHQHRHTTGRGRLVLRLVLRDLRYCCGFPRPGTSSR